MNLSSHCCGLSEAGGYMRDPISGRAHLRMQLLVVGKIVLDEGPCTKRFT